MRLSAGDKNEFVTALFRSNHFDVKQCTATAATNDINEDFVISNTCSYLPRRVQMAAVKV